MMNRLLICLRRSGNCWRNHKSQSAKSAFTYVKEMANIACDVTGQSAIRNPQSKISNGQHPGHSAPDQIDSQHRTNHQGDANGGGVKNAQSAAACPGGPSLRGVDEQSAGLAATAGRSQASSLAPGARSKKGAGGRYQHGQRLGGCAQN